MYNFIAHLFRIGLVLTVTLLMCRPLHAAPAGVAPVGVALVVGNADYTSLPTLPGCLLSARGIAAALKVQNYDVLDNQNLAIGQMDAAISALAKHLAATKGVPVVVYVCGYAADFNGRLFLLPVSAVPARPSDVLSQGMLAKVLIDTLARAGVTTALTVLDVLPVPGASGALPLETLDQPGRPPGVALLGAIESAGDAPTPLATTLIPLLRESRVAIPALFDAVQSRIGALRTVSLALRQPGTGSGILVGAPPVAPAPAAVMAAPVFAPAAPPVVKAPAPTLPDEAEMTDADRRDVQAALARLGYYGGKVDGIFGPDTRAAIRRFQHEIQMPMTGQLTERQANRLISTP
jgi:hypothetical protein